ncbi:DUF6252 family protein [Gelidibacter sp. F63206]|uniref:DUF6252 family protein n=1 Tax=Gelidibacter sp. F63206 TaxID=2926425 RepID=UPI001FF3F945|nr:DUF6252 family protein [Gelidibacter sp. F63206]MCK0115006.1 DUF6252 family protein [Gelidibacter sp. F63206]
MRKFVLLLIAIMTLFGCGNEVQFNTPALQANKNYQLWRATYYDAVLSENGGLTINAGNKIEKLNFMLPSLQERTYSLTLMSESKVVFIDHENRSYSTANPQNPESHNDSEIGQVIITEFDGNTITGTFRFMAYSADGLHSVGFNEGVFYKIPVR